VRLYFFATLKCQTSTNIVYQLAIFLCFLHSKFDEKSTLTDGIFSQFNENSVVAYIFEPPCISYRQFMTSVPSKENRRTYFTTVDTFIQY